jgi:hypothetical protein
VAEAYGLGFLARQRWKLAKASAVEEGKYGVGRSLLKARKKKLVLAESAAPNGQATAPPPGVTEVFSTPEAMASVAEAKVACPNAKVIRAEKLQAALAAGSAKAKAAAPRTTDEAQLRVSYHKPGPPVAKSTMRWRRQVHAAWSMPYMCCTPAVDAHSGFPWRRIAGQTPQSNAWFKRAAVIAALASARTWWHVTPEIYIATLTGNSCI